MLCFIVVFCVLGVFRLFVWLLLKQNWGGGGGGGVGFIVIGLFVCLFLKRLCCFLCLFCILLFVLSLVRLS